MRITLANKITILRILAVPAFILTVLYYSPQYEYLRSLALGIFLLAAASDFLDGYIARRFDQKTQIGSILDPLADKLLLTSAFLCLFVQRENFGEIQLPSWLLVVVISRDFILLVGAVIMHLINVKMKIDPSLAGKLTTVLQVMAVIAIFFQWEQSRILWWVIVVFSAATTIDYIKRNLQSTSK